MAHIRVLVVEDELITAREIQIRLRRLGYEPVGHTTTGEQAIVLAGQIRPDLVMMDIMLDGEMDGIGAAAQIRRDLSIPVVFLTIRDDAATLEVAQKAQPFGYIIKPFQDREMRSVVETALQLHGMEQALRKSERALQDAQTAAHIGTYTIDFSTGRWSGTSMLDSLFGIGPEYPRTIEGWVAMIQPSHREEISAHFRHVLALRTRFDREYPIRRVSDGSERWVSDRGVVECDPRGSLVRMIGTIQDITERKQAELALRRSEDHLRLTIDAVPSLLALIDRDCRYLIVNASYGRWFEARPEDVRGRTVREVIGDAGWEIVAPFVQRALNGETVRFQRELPLPKGGTHFIDATYIPDRDARGEVSGFVAVVHDLAETRRAEETLRMQAAALEAAGCAIIISDVTGNITWINPACSSLTGFSLEEAVGHPMSEFLEPDRREGLLRKARETLAAGEVWRVEMPLRCKDGPPCMVDAAVAAVRNETGAMSHLIAVAQDVTAQRKLEAQLLRAQRLESVGRLASGLAHDLNNILLPVLMAPSFLRKHVTSPEALEVLDTVETSVKRGADVIKQLLTFGRGSEGRRAPVCLNRMVSEMMTIIRETFPRSIEAACDLPPGTCMVSANPTQLHQVIMNLCFNSREAMPAGGQLMLRVEKVALTPQAAASIPDAVPGCYHVLSVADTGRGIPPEVMDRVFEPFFTTKDVGEGSGLGLSTVLGIVRSHRGFIQVRSEVGLGTEMRIHLPALDGV